MSLNLDKSTWKRVAFGDVVRNANVTVRAPETAGIDRLVAMEHLDRGELSIRRWGSLEDGTTFTRRVTPGQTLFGKRRAYQRKVAYAEFDAICSGDILTLEADESRMLSGFLPFLVQSNDFFDHALGTSAGSLSPRTNWRDLSNFEFDLPPLDEQHRIADLLWAIEHHRATVKQTSGGLSHGYDAWIEERLAGYQTTPLSAVVKLQPGRPVPSSLYGKGEFPLLRPGDMNANGSVGWSSTSVRVPQEFADKYHGWALQAGDLVINMTAQSLEDRFLGRVCRMHDHALLNQRIGRLAIGDGLSPAFAFVALRSISFSEWVARKSEGSKVKHMHWRHIADYPLPLPSLTEQAAIVREAESWNVATAGVVSELTALSDLRSSLLGEIFGGL